MGRVIVSKPDEVTDLSVMPKSCPVLWPVLGELELLGV